MAELLITDLRHFLDEAGDIISEPAHVKALASYLTAIVLMSSYPDSERPPEYIVTCRKRPKRKPCHGEVFGFIIPDSGNIMWMCPECNNRGLISNWRGTIWDLSEYRNVAH